MKRSEVCPQPEQFGDAAVPAFGYELIRSLLIPEILGKESATILYWSGRKIARQYPLDSEDKITKFFEQAGWGNLKLIESGKDKKVYECDSALIESRIKDHPASVLFTMEAGFLAEQIQKINGYVAEAYTDIHTGRRKNVVFTVKWDAKDPVGRMNASN